MLSMGLAEHWIPDNEDEARCNIFMSDLSTSTKLLIILQNQVCLFVFYFVNCVWLRPQVGSKPGLWSRSLCLTKGLHVGGMITAIERAISAGYAVAVLNPNTNSVTPE